MQANYKEYNQFDSAQRIDSILKAADESFEELQSIPNRDRLTYTNGFYVYCSAVFVDIRKSGELNQKLRRPTLSRIYRAYISEVVAAINGNPYCSEINIIGDCVSGVFDTPTLVGINAVFDTAAQTAFVINLLNRRLKVQGVDPIEAGIGISYGRALMIKAGFAGSGINDVVYVGPVVNEASHLSNYGRSTYSDKRTMVSDVFHDNLKDTYKALLTRNYSHACYHGDVINLDMENI